MNRLPSTFRGHFSPVANPDAIVQAPGVRFTVLTPRLLRLEHDPDESFVDRASQVFWHRRQPVPEFEVVEEGKEVQIITEALRLRYRVNVRGFTPDALSIELRGAEQTWHYGDVDEHNLKGTLRTLDLASGAAELEPGLLSRAGWVVVDDSDSLLFNEKGWLEPRHEGRAQDLYFFGYGHHYTTCLQDYFKVAGSVPLLPRWALGNWWSRYWAYSQEELKNLMLAFKEHQVPLSVCIVDMDWHITDTGNDCSGWTGYTWNRDLFPDPDAFLDWLHDLGLKTALNLHPAEGIYPHEERYEEMAKALGVNPQSEKPIPFDIADPQFARAYLEILHHPLEEQGVDFWWLDWQQGDICGLPDLDPLWWLNHLHFLDHRRDGERRPIIFSRWGGLGNHRYPVGFSGDTYVNWPSLAFQPFQTATAANVGFGWWSHDIGGHMQGVEEAELYTRWVQFGVFSPIMRLHSTNNPYHERRPWGYDAETLRIVRNAMQLRHALIPYLYTMSWRNFSQGIAPIRPMYHLYGQKEEAYHCPDQYTFGSELIVAPFTAPADADTRLSRQVVWLPPGEWFGFFDGRRLPGNAWHAIHGSLDAIPVFARAGAIVPLAPRTGWGGVENPDELEIHIFPGADNRFDLYEDDGQTLEYDQGHFALTGFSQQWQEKRLVFKVAAVAGERQHVPQRRTYRFVVHSLRRPQEVHLTVDGEGRDVETAYEEVRSTLRLGPLTLSPEESVTIDIQSADGNLMKQADPRRARLRQMVERFRLQTTAKQGIIEELDEILDDPAILNEYAVSLSQTQTRAMLEVIHGAGVHRIDHTGETLLLTWNNSLDPRVTFRLSQERLQRWRPEERCIAEYGAAPRFRAIRPARELPEAQWELSLHYGDVLSTTYRGGQ